MATESSQILLLLALLVLGISGKATMAFIFPSEALEKFIKVSRSNETESGINTKCRNDKLKTQAEHRFRLWNIKEFLVELNCKNLLNFLEISDHKVLISY